MTLMRLVASLKQLWIRLGSLSPLQKVILFGVVSLAGISMGLVAYRWASESTSISTGSNPIEIPEMIEPTQSIEVPATPSSIEASAAPVAPSPTPVFGLVKSIDKDGAYVVNRDGSMLRRIIPDDANWISCSPDGGRFSFDALQTGKVADLQGNIKKVSDEAIGKAAWSPDSRFLAHLNFGSSDINISIRSSSSGEERRSINTPGGDNGVAWSSRGLIASRTTEGIFTFKEDGSELRKIWQPQNNVEDIKWSPDGGTLVVAGGESGLIEEDGSNRRSLRSEGSDADFNVWSPDWSPSSSEIVYQAVHRSTGEKNLEISPRQGGSSKVIAKDLYYPAWSPDGKIISALETDRDPAFQRLVTISPSGEGKRTLIEAPARTTIAADYKPCWLGPDQILFVAIVTR